MLSLTEGGKFLQSIILRGFFFFCKNLFLGIKGNLQKLKPIKISCYTLFVKQRPRLVRAGLKSALWTSKISLERALRGK